VSESDPAPERRHVPKGKPPQAAQRQSSSYAEHTPAVHPARAMYWSAASEKD
jgi:hypothetical protein